MDMNLGVAVLLVTALGYCSNWINWHYLNYRIVQWLYYIGAFVHETSHAILCVLTGAKIVEYKIFSSQPRVVHQGSKLPLLGESLISLAPIAGGLCFLYAVNQYLLSGYFIIPQFLGWQDIALEAERLLLQINLLHWQSWVMIFLFFNLGAMIGPSPQDLKNMWPLLVLLCFFYSTSLANIALFASTLIVVTLAIQIAMIVGILIVRAMVGIRRK
jgi:hypothetical protein